MLISMPGMGATPLLPRPPHWGSRDGRAGVQATRPSLPWTSLGLSVRACAEREKGQPGSLEPASQPSPAWAFYVLISSPEAPLSHLT